MAGSSTHFAAYLCLLSGCIVQLASAGPSCTAQDLFPVIEMYPTYRGESRGVASADFDLDGDTDLVVAHPGPNQSPLTVLFNDGFGRFHQRLPIGTADADYFDVVAADFDNDGDVDIAASENGRDRMTLFRNTGAGAFAAPVSFGTQNAPQGIAAGDIDNDGDIDLIVANIADDSLSIFKNNGYEFNSPTTRFGLDGPRQVAIGDIDSDGDADLLIAQQGSGIQVLFNDGDGTFSSTATIGAANAEDVALADFDQDGDLDYVATIPSVAEIEVGLNSGGGLFEHAYGYAATPYVRYIAVGDLTGDNAPDIAVGDSFYGLHVYVSDSDGTLDLDGPLVGSANYPTGDTWSPAIADINGDGSNDCIAALETMNIAILVNTCELAGSCGIADLAEPFGTLDLQDITAFVTAFTAGCP